VVAATVGAGATGTNVLLIEVDPDIGTRTGAREMLGLAVELAPMIENMLAAARGDEPSAQLRGLLQQVIDEQQFRPVFQPICDIDTGAVVGFEALTRFDDGTPPDQRFAKAGLLGLGHALEIATLRAAMQAAPALPAGTYLSVNVSAPLLGHPELPAVLDLADGRCICVELTEHEQIDDYERTIADFRALGRGLRLSVDDAGSGWASLRHVFTLRPDYVKLDRGWVADIHTDPARQALLIGITSFVHELGGQVVAEGVERHTELATLRSLGIRFAQGYLLGKPARVGDLVAR
jgi:EAL domain-containing protein (putative c-di-GMP-specific phosphodiesterase class I)